VVHLYVVLAGDNEGKIKEEVAMNKFMRKPPEARARSELLARTWDMGAGARRWGGVGKILGQQEVRPSPRIPVSQKRNGVPRIPARIGPPMMPMTKAARWESPRKPSP